MDQESELQVEKYTDIRPEKISVDTGEFKGGTEGAVYAVEAKLHHGSKSKTIPLIHKIFDRPEVVPVLVQRYLRAKKAGLPVPTTFRLAKDGLGKTSLIMTDLSNRGQNLLIEAGYAKLDDKWAKILKGVKLDQYSKPNMPQGIYGMAQRAAMNGMDLSPDSFCFVLKPDGSNGFMFFDFGQVFTGARIVPEDKFLIIHRGVDNWDSQYEETITQQALFERNFNMLKRELEYINELQKKAFNM